MESREPRFPYDPSLFISEAWNGENSNKHKPPGKWYIFIKKIKI